MAKAGTDPEGIAYLAPDLFQPLVNFVLTNEIAEPKPQEFLLQGEKREMLFGDHRLFGVGAEQENNALRPFQVVENWQNLRGKKFKDTYNFDVRQFLWIPPTSSLFSLTSVRLKIE